MLRTNNNYPPPPPIKAKLLKEQERQQKKLRKDEEQEKMKEELKKLKEKIEIQNLFTIQQRNCKELNKMVKLITNIYTNNKKSYTTSNGLTNDIIKLKEIVQKIEGNHDIKEAVGNLDKSIKGENKEGKKEGKKEEDGKTKTVPGLSNSYLMIQSAIIKYAQTIKCPKKEESLDGIINYFYNWAKKNIIAYNTILLKMGKLDYQKNKEKFPFPQIIFPLYIITKIILHRNLHNSSGTQSSRTRNTKNIINITKYLNPHLNDVAKIYLKSIFTPFFDLYFKNKKIKDVDTSINPEQYDITPPYGKTVKEHFERPDLTTFIDNFENLLKKLTVIDQKNFEKHFNTEGPTKTFKKHLYESILNNKYDYIGPHFSYGILIPQRKPWTNVNFKKAKDKGFRQWFEMILSRKLLGVETSSKYDRTFRKTRKKITDQGERERDELRRRLRISNTQKNKTRRLRAENPSVGKRVRNKAWKQQDNDSNIKFAKKNNPSPPPSRKVLRAKTPPVIQGTTPLENDMQKFIKEKLKENKGTNNKAYQFGGKKKKHTKRNKKRHNKKKYTKKNK